MNIHEYCIKILEELGLLAVWNSSIDTKLLLTQRFVRLFAYGATTLILVTYLVALGISEERIGLFMTLTLFGDMLISFCLTLIADGLGRRVVLALGAFLMSGSGVVFVISRNYWILLAAAVFGVISPSGNEIGPFRAIEESTLAHLSVPEVRSDIYAWYALVGPTGAAFGMITCGWVVRQLESLEGWDEVQAYRVMFIAYSGLGVIKFFLAIALSKKVEAEKESPLPQSNSERAPLLTEEGPSEANGTDPGCKSRTWAATVLPHINPESRIVIINLCLLFALDAFSSSLVSLSWVTYFFKWKFHLKPETLGSLFFTTSIIAAFSTIVASSISKRFGNIKTMVFTHLPSSIALALIPIPSQLPYAMFFLILRSCTQSMDVAPRSAFLATVILPAERTAVMGMINVVKTLSSTIGPSITGTLANRGVFWVSFIIAGSLKATYDLSILAVFATHISRESKAKAAAKDAQRDVAEQQGPLAEAEA